MLSQNVLCHFSSVNFLFNSPSNQLFQVMVAKFMAAFRAQHIPDVSNPKPCVDLSLVLCASLTVRSGGSSVSSSALRAPCVFVFVYKLTVRPSDKVHFQFK